ncbi:hypothetical protein SLS59_001879 [Nothophoma quercina]|uniref:Cardiolipin synthetase n=1 Tax=Nothophoma quercina TaxID=749835 RepID=A0ABR3RW79_9PLEO
MSSIFTCRSSGTLRAASRLQGGQSFLLSPSRASCSWARNDNIGRCQILLRPKSRPHYGLQQRGVFSTSIRRNADGKAEKNVTSQGLSEHKQETDDLSTTAKVAATLKSSLKLDTPTQRREQIYNIPNFLTLTRLIATPAVGYLIVHNQHLAAFSLFTYAAFSDLLDGWIARKWKLQTVVGSVVDPMADKFLMTTLVTCLAVNGSMAAPLAVIILGRDVSLAVSALYYRYASLPAPKTMARYWDFSLPSAEVHPTQLSKYNTFLQLCLLGTLLCTNLLHDPVAITSAAGGFLMSIQDILGGEPGVKNLVTGLSAVVASTTLYSGLEYTWKKDAVKILGGNEELKRKQGLRGRMIMLTSYGAFIAIAAALWFRGSSKEDIEQQAEPKQT